MKQGRPATKGKVVMSKLEMCRTVADLVRETGADPRTVRKVLIRASDRGEIVLRRFVQGKSGRAMVVVR